jgi:hypothetical protein
MYSAAQHAVHLGLDSISPGGALNTPADSNGLSGLCFSSYRSCFLRLFGDALLSLGIQVLGNMRQNLYELDFNVVAMRYIS